MGEPKVTFHVMFAFCYSGECPVGVVMDGYTDLAPGPACLPVLLDVTYSFLSRKV